MSTVTLTTIPKPADRADWLAARRPYIGASEISATLGRHPYITARDLWQAKLVTNITGEPPPLTPAMRRGIAFEAGVAALVAEDLGVDLHEPDVLYIADDVLLATLDRLTSAGVPVEIKTTRRDGPPSPHWHDQVQQQLLCTGADYGWLAVFHLLTDRLTIHKIDADPVHQADLLLAGTVFLAAIDEGVVPEAVRADYDSQRVSDVTADRVDLDSYHAALVADLAAVSRRIAEYEQDEKVLRGRIGRILGGAAEGWYEDRRLVTFRSVTRITIDGTRFRHDHPDLAAGYATTTSYRQLRVVTS